jgi:hypothetical protein
MKKQQIDQKCDLPLTIFSRRMALCEIMDEGTLKTSTPLCRFHLVILFGVVK